MNMSYMFYYAQSFKANINTKIVDQTKRWDVSNVTDMSYMFLGR